MAILAAGVALAAGTHSLEGLAGMVRDAAVRGQNDRDLARALHRVELDELLDNRTAEELESLSPGPKSIAEIERLREVSSSQRQPKALPPFPSPPEPSLNELRNAVKAAGDKALAYTAGLPDFICTETVRRHERNYRGWAAQDTLTVELTYFDHAERYKLTEVNGYKTRRTYDQLRGATSKGEFGSMLFSVFAPASRTAFQWSNWTTLRKRPAYVLSFRIETANSGYSLTAATREGVLVSAVVGEHGFVYIDRETKDVLRLDAAADSIPTNFPLEAASRTLDFGPAEVSGRTFLLPLHADVRMSVRDESRAARNQVEFTGYRKFTGQSSISFGDAEAGEK
jgi:hypothetical protein